jgi:hypothetical protein
MEKSLWVVAAMVIVLGFSASVPAQTNKVDVSGIWVFTVQTDAGTSSPTVTLKQDGEKLTGHYSSETLGEADLTGSVKGTSFEVTYVGTIEDSGLKGTLDLAGMAQGTFTAKRK